MDDFLAAISGEYNNNEQVWQQDLDKVELSPKLHVRIQALPLRSGESGFFVLESEQAGEDSSQRWLYTITAHQESLQLQARVLHTEVSQLLTCEDIDLCIPQQGSPDFVVTLDAQTYASAQWALADDLLSVAPSLLAIPQSDERSLTLNLRRVRYFKGWISLQRKHIDPGAADDDYIFMKDVRLHNEGDRAALVDNDGTPTGYTVELARLSYQRTRAAILKIGIIEDASDYTLSYAWTSVGATRLGINLRWIQAGFTAIAPQSD